MLSFPLKKIFAFLVVLTFLVNAAPKETQASDIEIANLVVVSGGAFILALCGGAWLCVKGVAWQSSEYWDRRYCFERGAGFRDCLCLSCCLCLPKKALGYFIDLDPPEHDPTMAGKGKITVDMPLDDKSGKVVRSLMAKIQDDDTYGIHLDGEKINSKALLKLLREKAGGEDVEDGVDGGAFMAYLQSLQENGSGTIKIGGKKVKKRALLNWVIADAEEKGFTLIKEEESDDDDGEVSDRENSFVIKKPKGKKKKRDSELETEEDD